MRALFIVLLLAGCGSGSGPVTSPAPVANVRQEIACPAQTPDTMVILAFGQSNSANHLEHSYSSDHVVNFFQGKCFLAQDPLFGATGTAGSMWTLLGNKLQRPVILITIGRRTTFISDWEQNSWLEDGMKTPYTITHFLWHHGEADAHRTSGAAYEDSLRNIIGRTKAAFPDSRFYVSVASMCGDSAIDPDIEAAQMDVIGLGVFQGPNTDIYDKSYRLDGCHLGAVAQELVTDEWARLLH